jgi:hypothetical protein
MVLDTKLDINGVLHMRHYEESVPNVGIVMLQNS